MNGILKNTMKLDFGVCAALGVVTVGAEIASGTAVKVVAEGFKTGAEAMKKTMVEIQNETKKKPPPRKSPFPILQIKQRQIRIINISQTIPKTFVNMAPVI